MTFNLVVLSLFLHAVWWSQSHQFLHPLCSHISKIASEVASCVHVSHSFSMWLRVIDSSNRFYFLYIINVLRFAERNMCTFFVFFLGLLHKLVVGPCSPCMFMSSLSLGENLRFSLFQQARISQRCTNSVTLASIPLCVLENYSRE